MDHVRSNASSPAQRCGPSWPASVRSMKALGAPRVRSVSAVATRLMLTFCAAATMTVSACSTAPPSRHADPAPAFVLPADVGDQRGRFREIFCAVLEERGETLPDFRLCGDALRRVDPEPEGTGTTVELGPSTRHLVAVFVPGLGWECVSDWLDVSGTAATHVRRFGYDAVAIMVGAFSSSTANARQIRDEIMAGEPQSPEPRLVLIGYSKGTPDILEAITDYPEIRPRIAAVVSLAGAVGGSAIADEVTQSQLELLRHWPDADCSPGDGGAVESLRPSIRQAWLAEHTLPHDVPFYSLVTYPTPERISSVLKPTFRQLSKIDPRNDGMMLLDDQIIPRSRLLGLVNADHWAVAVPIARSHPGLGATLVDRNDYPREALLEAVLRFVEEDLATIGR